MAPRSSACLSAEHSRPDDSLQTRSILLYGSTRRTRSVAILSVLPCIRWGSNHCVVSRSSAMCRIIPQYTTELCGAAKAVTCVKWSCRTVLRAADTCLNLQISKVATPMSGKVVLEYELILAGPTMSCAFPLRKFPEKRLRKATN